MDIGISNSIAISIQQYQKAYEKALAIFNVLEDADEPELLRMLAELSSEVEKMLNVSGLGWEQCGSLSRHLHFLEYYLNRGQKKGGYSDVKDIVFYDLPEALKNIINSSSSETHFDQQLRDAVFPLVQGGHYDSAIRKAFVVLTERLRRAFGVTEELDGDDLINLVFGKGGKIPVALDDGKKQAFRNMISGFYGVYRNKYAHNDVEPTLSETKAILEMANNIIKEVEQISMESVQ